MSDRRAELIELTNQFVDAFNRQNLDDVVRREAGQRSVGQRLAGHRARGKVGRGARGEPQVFDGLTRQVGQGEVETEGCAFFFGPFDLGEIDLDTAGILHDVDVATDTGSIDQVSALTPSVA